MSDEHTLKLPALTREMVCERLAVDSNAIKFPFSSEAPVARMFGNEILSHANGAMRADRFQRGAVPLLWNHDWDQPVGMVDRAYMGDDRRTYADAHFFDTDRAKEVKAMLAGGLRNVSFGYRVHEVTEHRDGSYTATDWEPFEISIVSVPADASVGVGRSADTEERLVRVLRADTAVPATTKETAMSEVAATAPAGATAAEVVNDSRAIHPSVRVIEDTTNAIDLERNRVRGIDNLCRANKIDTKIRDHWVGAGLSLDQVSDDLLSIIKERGETNPQSPALLGLSRAETKRYSICRALLAVMDKDWTQAGYELECSRAIAQKLGKSINPTSFFVPFEVQKRDMTVASASGGGYLVDTENLGFIDLLRNRSVAFNMGATRLSGLTGNITVPKQTSGATAYWLSTESTQITEGNQVFGQMALSPKTVGAYTEISRQLLLQSSPDAESIVTADLAAQVATAADLAVLNGSGAAGQPTGIIGTSGVGSTTATTVDYGKVLDFQADLAAANVFPMAGGYVTTSAVAKILMTKQRFSSTDTPLWEGTMWDGRMTGFRAMSSEQIPSGYMIFGDWSKVVVGEWGVLEVNVNPFANFQAGIIGVRAMYTLDVGVRYAAAFSVSTSVTA